MVEQGDLPRVEVEAAVRGHGELLEVYPEASGSDPPFAGHTACTYEDLRKLRLGMSAASPSHG